MLNPSTADADNDDNTIKRCIGFSKSLGDFDVLKVVNLFAFRSSNPRKIKQAVDPVGPENHRYLRDTIIDARLYGVVIAAWGSFDVGDRVKEIDIGVQLKCLGKNQNGSPKHPLYLRGDARLIDWP